MQQKHVAYEMPDVILKSISALDMTFYMYRDARNCAKMRQEFRLLKSYFVRSLLLLLLLSSCR